MKKNLIISFLIALVLIILINPVYAATSKTTTPVTVAQVKNAKVESTTTKTVNLSWSKVSGATGYQVYMYDMTQKKYVKYTTTKNVKQTVTKLAAGQSYYFKIRAYKTVNKVTYYGAFSSALTTTTLPLTVSNVKMSTQTTSSVKITWNKVSGATGYQVFMYDTTQKKYLKYISTGKLEQTITNLMSGQTYDFKIRAYRTINKVTYYGAFSSVLTTTTLPEQVKNVSLSNNKSSDITLKWSAVARAKGYRIYKYNNSKAKWETYKDVAGTSAVISKSKSDINLKLRVCAYTKIGGTKYFGANSSVCKTKKAIDVSEFNGAINWQAVKKAGIEYVIIRAGGRYYGRSNGKIYEDQRFKTNITQAAKLGFKIGVYFYTSAINQTEARAEANFCINKLKAYGVANKVKYIAYDFEAYNMGRMSDYNESVWRKNAVAFLNTVKTKGYTPMLYSYKYCYETALHPTPIVSQVSGCKIWYAHYTSSMTDYSGKYDMWQYTSTGRVSGVNGNVDISIVYM